MEAAACNQVLGSRTMEEPALRLQPHSQ